MNVRVVVALFFATYAIVAQCNSTSGVTVSVRRSAIVRTSIAELSVSIRAPRSLPFGEVLDAARQFDAVAANLSSVQSFSPTAPGESPSFLWRFTTRTPAANLGADLARFTPLILQLASSKPALATYVELMRQIPSDADISAARRSLWPAIWSEVRTRAEKLAAATEVPLEPLASVCVYGPSSGSIASDYGDSQNVLIWPFTLVANFNARPHPGASGIFIHISQPDTSPAHVAALVVVTGPSTLTLEDALARTRSLGLSAEDLSSSSIRAEVGPSSEHRVSFGFEYRFPISAIESNLARLEQVARPVPDSALTVDYSLDRIKSTEADRLAAGPAAWTALARQGHTLAAEVAAAAGMRSGPAIGVSDESGGFFLDYVGFARRTVDLNLRYPLIP